MEKKKYHPAQLKELWEWWAINAWPTVALNPQTPLLPILDFRAGLRQAPPSRCGSRRCKWSNPQPKGALHRGWKPRGDLTGGRSGSWSRRARWNRISFTQGPTDASAHRVRVRLRAMDARGRGLASGCGTRWTALPFAKVGGCFQRLENQPTQRHLRERPPLCPRGCSKLTMCTFQTELQSGPHCMAACTRGEPGKKTKKTQTHKTEFLYKKLRTYSYVCELQSPSKYLHLIQYTYQDVFSTVQKFSNSLIVMPFSVSAIFCFTSSTSGKHFPLRSFFHLGKQTKVPQGQDRVNREGGAQGIVRFLVQNCWTLSVVWAGVLVSHPSWNGQTCWVFQKKIHWSQTQPLTTMPAGPPIQIGFQTLA